MEDNLNFKENEMEDDINFFQIETNLKKMMHPKTIKS
jgi:hypothetical protein